MQYPPISKLALIVFLILPLIYSCKKDKEKETNTLEDQKAMLANTGDNIILPRYAELKEKTSDLHASAKSFTSSPDQNSLSDLQTKFKEAYISWQSCSAFEFGPAMDIALRSNLNTFPCDTAEINSSVATGNWDFGAYTSVDLKGFPAVDYLINDINSNNTLVINRFTTDTDASNRKKYLTDITTEIKNLSSSVSNEWSENNGNYIGLFKSIIGTDAGSPISMLVNQMNFDWEIIKNNKVGIPAGKKSLGTLYPEKTEGYYGKLSLELAEKNILAIHELYLGKSNSKDGEGLYEYLKRTDAEYQGKLLADEIDEQFSKAYSAVKNIPPPLSNAVSSDKTKVDKAYEELQRQVVLMKTDMPSALGIRITYQDNDGD